MGRALWAACVAVMACGEPAPTPIVGSDVGHQAESLSTGAIRASHAAPGFQVIVDSDGEMSLLDLADAPTPMGLGAGIREVVTWGVGRLLILTDEGLVIWDGALRPTLLADALGSTTVEHVGSLGNTLFIATGEGLRLWWENSFNSVSIDGVTLLGPFAAGPVNGSRGMWIGTADGVVALALSEEAQRGKSSEEPAVLLELQEQRVLGGTPDAMTVDHDGNLWVVQGGLLHRRPPWGGWHVFSATSPLRWVAANPTSPRIWLGSEDGVLTSAGGEFGALSEPPAGLEHATVDDVGRLIAHDGETLWRLSIGYPLAVRGLPDGGVLFGLAEVALFPTARDRVSTVGATLDEAALSVRNEDGLWQVDIDAALLAEGRYELAVEVAYDDAGETMETWELAVVNPTWSKEVEPIFEADCKLCHSGKTGPLGLDKAEAWQENFGEILDRLEYDDMPAGRPPLSPLEKGIIRAWGAKGFALAPEDPQP